MKFHQEDTLRRIIDRIKSELNIVINRFRADCGSFSKEIVRVVEERCNTFYIRASNCASRYEEFRQHDEWKSVEIGYEKCDVATIRMNDFIEGKSYRLVVQRSPLKDGDGNVQKDMFGIVYTYRCILTNDWKSTEKECVHRRHESGRKVQRVYKSRFAACCGFLIDVMFRGTSWEFFFFEKSVKVSLKGCF